MYSKWITIVTFLTILMIVIRTVLYPIFLYQKPPVSTLLPLLQLCCVTSARVLLLLTGGKHNALRHRHS